MIRDILKITNQIIVNHCELIISACIQKDSTDIFIIS